MNKINTNSNQAFQLLMSGAEALARAEAQGIRIDIDYAENKKIELSEKIDDLETEFMESEFYKYWKKSRGNKVPNIYSNSQLSKFLYEVKKIEVKGLTDSGQGSTDEEALTQLNIPEISILLQIRKLKKIRDTYLEAFVREQVDGYIHPSFALHLVRTFRSSSSGPNMQNTPKRDKEAFLICRKALFPRPGHQLMEADLSGAEVKIALAYHKDPTMLKYVNDPTSDMHADMAKQIFLLDKFDKNIPEYKILRNATKNGFVFPQFYGDYYKNCAQNMAISWCKLTKGKWKIGQGIPMPEGHISDHLISKGIKSFDAFVEHIKTVELDFWGNRFKVYAKWKESHWKAYQRNGYVDLLTGFRCSGVMGKNDAINYPVQGSAFHCLLFILIRLDAVILKNGWDSKIISQVHDSIVIDANPEEIPLLIKAINRIVDKDLPNEWKWINAKIEIDIEISPIDCSWADLEKAK